MRRVSTTDGYNSNDSWENSLGRLNTTAKSFNMTDSFQMGNGSSIKLLNENTLVDFPDNREISEIEINAFADNIIRNGFNSVILVAPELSFDETATNIRRSENEASMPRTGTPTGRYILISGHRRTMAFRKVLEQKPEFMDRKLPAIILRQNISWNDLEEMNILFNTDVQELTPKEKREQIVRLVELYKKRGLAKEAIEKAKKKFNLGQTQLYSYLKIEYDLIDDFKTAVDNGNVDSTTATKIAGLSKEKQERLYNSYVSGNGISLTEIALLAQDSSEDTKRLLQEEEEKRNALLKEIDSLKAQIKSGDVENTSEQKSELKRLQMKEKRSRDKSDKLKSELENPSVEDAHAVFVKHAMKLEKDIRTFRTNLANHEFTSDELDKVYSLIDSLRAVIG